MAEIKAILATVLWQGERIDRIMPAHRGDAAEPRRPRRARLALAGLGLRMDVLDFSRCQIHFGGGQQQCPLHLVLIWQLNLFILLLLRCLDRPINTFGT